MLGWESGLALGIGLGYACFEDANVTIIVSLVLAAAALLMYHLYTHNWFVKHKNR